VAHARKIGRAPRGMWPPEGSVSPEAVRAYARNQVAWLATDEGNLWRSRDLAGLPSERGDLYQAYRYASVDLLFRDRELSDRVGFAYAHGDSAAGAEDLLERAAACAAGARGPATPVVPIFLDGENPWEAYPGSGEPFLRALFSRLDAHPALEAVSLGEHLERVSARTELPALHSGSWIDSDFHIWIGDPVKNRAWSLLARARHMLERASADGLADERRGTAEEHLLAAEGSDWFWWFGEPFHTAEDEIFDRLFRAHVAAACRALGTSVPVEATRPIADAATPRRPLVGATPPFALITPPIDGQGGRGRFYAWQGAGRYAVPRGAQMADSPWVEVIHFGFDRERWYLRVDPSPGRLAELAGLALEVELMHDGRRLLVTSAGDGWRLDELGDGGPRAVRLGAPAVFGRSLELAVPFLDLGIVPGDLVSFAVRVVRGDGPLGRYPPDGWLTFNAPDDGFEAEHWSV
jgi:hypothetical protein